MKPGERGAALLTVLMLVSVMAVLSASALERLRLATRIAANAGAIDQARAYALAAEDFA
jgi:general secretion pathway protein K